MISYMKHTKNLSTKYIKDMSTKNTEDTKYSIKGRTRKSASPMTHTFVTRIFVSFWYNIFRGFRVLRGQYNLMFFVVTALLLASCTSTPQDATKVDKLPAIYPDYAGVTIPAGIAPMDFDFTGGPYDCIDVVVKGSKGGELHANGDDVDFDVDDWHALTQQNKGGDLTFTVSVENDGHWTQYKDFKMTVSPYALDEWGLSYRRIAPGYEVYGHMGIYQRDLTGFDVEPIIVNSQNNGGCVNCHSFANYSPRDFTFHARGKNGGTIVMRNGKMKKVDIKAMSGGRHGSYNIWHPSCRYIAFSSNSTHQSFYGQSKDKIEVYDLWSDLIVYDIEAEKVLQDERFTDSLNLEMFPSFSPDGKWLYFSTAKPVFMPIETDKLNYSIVRVPFDESTGKLGAIDTVWSSYEHGGGTAMMPRLTPDGRYMLFSLSRCGAFNLYHTESDLRMLDLQTGRAVPTDVLNSPRAESYHAWSSNGRWILCSSRRDDGNYTRTYFAYFDKQGRLHKPFEVPATDPEYFRLFLRSWSRPEFMKEPVRITPRQFYEKALTEPIKVN